LYKNKKDFFLLSQNSGIDPFWLMNEQFLFLTRLGLSYKTLYAHKNDTVKELNSRIPSFFFGINNFIRVITKKDLLSEADFCGP